MAIDSPVLAALLTRLKQRYRVLAPLALLALVRYVYHKRQRHLEQLRVHRKINDELAHARHVVHHHHSHKQLHERLVPEELLGPVEEWHDVAGGAQTQSIVYHALPDTASGELQSNVLVLILPGNPGLAHYYLPLMRALVQRHGRRHEVRCMSHTGHFMPWKNNGRAFSFQEQIEHKCTYLRGRIAANPALRLVLICHSIGAFVTLQIARQFPQHIAKLCLMQPTITHIGKTRKGLALMPLFRHRSHSIKFIYLIEFLCPLAVRQWLIRLAIGGNNEAVLHHATLSLVNRNVMRNVLLMAFHEMQQVGDLDDQLVADHEDKTLFVYSPTDDWVPNEYVQRYQTRFGKARHRMVPQSHGFMMDAHGTRDMAEHISQWIAEELDDHEPVCTAA